MFESGFIRKRPRGGLFEEVGVAIILLFILLLTSRQMTLYLGQMTIIQVRVFVALKLKDMAKKEVFSCLY